MAKNPVPPFNFSRSSFHRPFYFYNIIHSTRLLLQVDKNGSFNLKTFGEKKLLLRLKNKLCTVRVASLMGNRFQIE